mmetsp:Transcript_21647/g.24279  ORF Transcript_21647/g.24279 Transcript_21647/m.24279 type:complete len:168 (+) Transcript_21647:383-886(+)
MLSMEIVKDPGSFILAIMDMAIETRILCDCDHPNIIKARAFAKISPFNENYFIMMDRLYDTMGKRIKRWATSTKRCQGLGGKIFDRKGEKIREIWEKKLVAAFDLSDALGYLHDRNIVYRDIKPENIGFDVVRKHSYTCALLVFRDITHSMSFSNSTYCLITHLLYR